MGHAGLMKKEEEKYRKYEEEGEEDKGDER